MMGAGSCQSCRAQLAGYWSTAEAAPLGDHSLMLCSMPLVATRGKVGTALQPAQHLGLGATQKAS